MRASLALVAVAVLGCTHEVNQDENTGPDGDIDGAVDVPVVDGHAQTTDVVSYPGGDRVDWKRIELPAGQHGALDVRMTWEPTEPGLQLAFDVFDATARPIVTSQAQSRRGHVRTASVIDARGIYFVRVYAVGRSDAGTYNLELAFHPAADTPIGPTGPPIAIPLPPPLPATPPGDETCTPDKFDTANPACATVCPAVGAPANWAGCATCTTFDANNPACQKIAPCPFPPDPRFASCKPAYPPCDPKAMDPANPNCRDFKAPPPPAVDARIINVEVVDERVQVTLAVGTDAGVARGWRCYVVRGDHTPVGDGALEILRVLRRTTVAKSRLSNQAIVDSPHARCDPPAP